MKSIDDFHKLIGVMCTSLVGETVFINWRAPIVIGFSGQAYIDSRGVICFDIDPGLSPEKTYEIAVHESSHCIAGHLVGMPPMELPEEIERMYREKGPILERTKHEDEQYWHDPQELEARNISAELDRIAQSRSMQLFGNIDVENRIVVLSQIEILRPEE